MTTFASDVAAFPIPDDALPAVLDYLGVMPNPNHRETVENAMSGAVAGEAVRLPVTACDALLDAYAIWERAHGAE